MIAVMYHYIHAGGTAPPYGYYHLDTTDFRQQLDYFQETYRILDRERFLNTIQGDRDPRDDDLVLTFDDGLKDHSKNVLPELLNRELWGLFYVAAGPYVDGRVLDVHRIHTLLGARGGNEVAAVLNDVLDESMVVTDNRERFEDVVYQDQANTDSVEYVKRLLNYYVSEEELTSVLDRLERQLLGSPLDPSDVYLSRDEIRALSDAGMHIGSHSTTHRVMSKLSRADQYGEIYRSFDFLEEVLGDLSVRSYCHPYGGSHSYTETTLELLAEADCKFGFDVESRPITHGDIQEANLYLPRYDCNEFPHGEATVSLG